MTTTTLPRQRDPVAKAVLLILAGAVAWLGVTQPGPRARAERAQVIMIATPTLAVGSVAAQEPPQATIAPTTEAQPTPAPVEALVAPTAEAQVIVQQVIVEVPAPAPQPEVVYVPVEAPPTVDPQPFQESVSEHGTKAVPDRAAHYKVATADPADPAHAGER